MEEEFQTIQNSEKAMSAIASIGFIGIFGFGLWFSTLFLGFGVSFVSAVGGLLFYIFLRRNIQKKALSK